jgi:hypothetical protein
VTGDHELAAALRRRLPEIEGALAARLLPLDGPGEDLDPGYEAGVRLAIGAALSYAVDAIEASGPPPPMPSQLLTQARLAVSYRVGLDRVLRRYFAGYALLSNFVIEEMEKLHTVSPGAVSRQLAAQAALLERLTEAITEEYQRSSGRSVAGARRRLTKEIEELLAADRADIPDLTYELDGWHLGAVGWGDGAAQGCRELAARLDRQILLVPRDDGGVWAWLGGRRRPRPDLLVEIPDFHIPRASIAIGELGAGLAGWRRSHLQAKAALPLALQRPERVTRYSDVGLQASLARDDLLRSALRERYLTPLEDDRDGGATARQTLRAYLRSGRNVSSAAAALGVDRHTVANRLRSMEEQIGCSIQSCLTEIDLVLRLET